LRVSDGSLFALARILHQIQAFDPIQPGTKAAQQKTTAVTVQAPRNGSIVRLMSPWVIRCRQAMCCCVLESEKMEHSIRAPQTGAVTALYCTEGVELVARGPYSPSKNWRTANEACPLHENGRRWARDGLQETSRQHQLQAKVQNWWDDPQLPLGVPHIEVGSLCRQMGPAIGGLCRGILPESSSTPIRAYSALAPKPSRVLKPRLCRSA